MRLRSFEHRTRLQTFGQDNTFFFASKCPSTIVFEFKAWNGQVNRFGSILGQSRWRTELNWFLRAFFPILIAVSITMGQALAWPIYLFGDRQVAEVDVWYKPTLKKGVLFFLFIFMFSFFSWLGSIPPWSYVVSWLHWFLWLCWFGWLGWLCGFLVWLAWLALLAWLTLLAWLALLASWLGWLCWLVWLLWLCWLGWLGWLGWLLGLVGL